jgi:Spy/CpxP family protein refolding chaperone
MSRVKWVIVLAFFVVFGAGAVVGMATRSAGTGEPGTQPPPPPPQGNNTRPSRGNRPPFDIATALGLNTEQRQQMKEIFEPLRNRQAFDDKRHALQRDRETAVRALLSDDQRTKYEQVLKDYEDKVAALETERDQAFKNAVEKAKSIMNDEQRKKYDEVLAHRADPHRRGPSTRPGGPDHDHGDHMGPPPFGGDRGGPH